MGELSKTDFQRILAKYGERISSDLQRDEPLRSVEYKMFLKEKLPRSLSFYEKACKWIGNLFTIGLSKKREAALKEYIRITHLDVTPSSIEVLSFMAPLLYMVLGGFISFFAFNSLFFAGFFVISGLVLILPLRSFPRLMANFWRMKASNQMVLCVFYIVTYMRHSSNLERAINFASEHLSPPLSLDLKKVIWDVENQKYENIKESLDVYLETWRKYNMEFIEAIHLIEGSLYEETEARRLSLLDKSLDVILTETYEKMLHYSHNLKSPITMVYMLGVILPILGLVILPLIVSFLGEVEWFHIAVLYNLVLPLLVFYMGRNILSTRPTGYGETDITEANPKLKKFRKIILPIGPLELKINPLWISFAILIVCFIIGFLPLFIGAITAPEALLAEKPFLEGTGFKFLDFRESSATIGPKVGTIVGPYGIGAAILSLFFPLGIGMAIGFYFSVRTKRLIQIRNQSKKLEQEFASALFQLGNRLGDGLPAEIAFGKVGQVMEGTVSGSFFQKVSMNIQKLGMGVREAIFSKKVGALSQYPSATIESSMKVFIEAIKKGPTVASHALLSISRYIKEIHRVDERLKDLLADVISSMKSQINFMAPVISGIVVGITSMITGILGRLKEQAALIAVQEGAGGRVALFSDLFGDAIPTYYFQAVVGIYVIQIVLILTRLSNGIENGADSLNEKYQIGKNMMRSTVLYIVVALFVMILFNFIAGSVVGRTSGLA